MAWDNNRRPFDTNVYTEDQVRSVLEEIGVKIVSETHSEFLCYCVYHSNRDNPAMAVWKSNGVFYCFNPSCNTTGKFIKLVMDVTELKELQALRVILRNKKPINLKNTISEMLEKKHEPFDKNIIDNLHANFMRTSRAQEYLSNRHIYLSTSEKFKIGYSFKKGMITVPFYSYDNIPLGFIGRSIDFKRFKNSNGLPVAQEMFNINNARRGNGKVIIVESSLDVMRLDQCGYNAIATCGGTFTDRHLTLINRYFTDIIIMTDHDPPDPFTKKECTKCSDCKGHNPGRALGEKIAGKLARKNIRWAAYDLQDSILYPNNAKDPGDMTDSEIKQCIENSVSHFSYMRAKKTLDFLAVV